MRRPQGSASHGDRRMTDEDQHALIGRTIQEHKDLKRRLACLKAKSDQMKQAAENGLRLIEGETTGHVKDGSMFVATAKHHHSTAACDWPSVEAIGELVADREETESRLDEVTKRLRDMGLGDYVKS